MKIKITIFQLDSKKRERIIESKILDSREEAIKFIENFVPKPKPYPIGGKDSYYVMSAI